MSRTLFDALQELPDQRGRKGRQIPLPAILALAVAAMLAGADSLIAIFRWGRRLRPEALRLLGCVRAGARPFASLRNIALAMLGGSRMPVPAAREAYAADSSSALCAITGRIL